MVLGERRYIPRMDAGELRTRITLLTSTVTKVASGAQTVTYANFETNPEVWAKVIFAHGQESVASEALKNVQRATVTIRYRSDVTARDAIQLNGQTWKIIGTPDNILNRNQYLEFQCELVGGSV